MIKLHKIIVLSLVSFTLYGCNSDEISSLDDLEKPSNNTVYTLTDSQLIFQLPAALDANIKNDVLPNGKHFVVDVEASTNHTTFRSQVAMVNSSGIDAAIFRATVKYYSIPQNASRVHDGLADNVTYTTSVDSKGVIYAGTTGGLSISKDGGKTFIYKTSVRY